MTGAFGSNKGIGRFPFILLKDIAVSQFDSLDVLVWQISKDSTKGNGNSVKNCGFPRTVFAHEQG